MPDSQMLALWWYEIGELAQFRPAPLPKLTASARLLKQKRLALRALARRGLTLKRLGGLLAVRWDGVPRVDRFLMRRMQPPVRSKAAWRLSRSPVGSQIWTLPSSGADLISLYAALSKRVDAQSGSRQSALE